MASELNNCDHCGKERVSDGDWIECGAIVKDFPEIGEIRNETAFDIVYDAYKKVLKLRCDFIHPMNWAFAKDAAKIPKVGADGLLTLPHWMSLRPAAMIKMEEELVRTAKNLPEDWPPKETVKLSDIDLPYMAKLYVERFKQFLLNQRNQALGLAGK